MLPSFDAPSRHFIRMGCRPPVRVESLLARVQDLHRPTRPLRQLRHAELQVEWLRLPAERAAHRRLYHPDPGHVQIQDPGQLPVQVVRDLGRAPDGELPVRVGHADGAVGLDGGMSSAFEIVIPIYDSVTPIHLVIDLAEGEVHDLRDVAVPALLLGGVDGDGVGVGLRLLGLQRVPGIEEGRERLVHDGDGVERCDGRVLVHGAHGAHGGHGVAHVSDPVDAERLLVAHPRDDAVLLRHVLPRDDGVDAVHGLGGGGVDGEDPGVGVGRAQDLPVEHSRQRDVVGVAGAAAQVARQCLLDLLTRQVRVPAQEPRRRHEHAGRAEPALRRAFLTERLLQRVRPVGVRQPFHRDHLPPFSLQRGGCDTRQRGRAVQQDGARAAVALVAPLLRPREPEAVAERFQQRPVAGHAERTPVTVHRQGNGGDHGCTLKLHPAMNNRGELDHGGPGRSPGGPTGFDVFDVGSSSRPS